MNDFQTIPKRQELFELLNNLYGEVEEETKGFSLGNYSSQEIAEELGYHPSQFSRLLKDAIRNQATEETYRRAIQRLKTIRENQQLKQESLQLKAVIEKQSLRGRNMYIIGTLCVILAGVSLLFFILLTQKQLTDQELILTTTQREAVLDLYSEVMENSLTLEATLFFVSLKEGVYKDDPTYYLQLLQNRSKNIIINNRHTLAKTQLKAENGVYLSDMITRYIDNKFNSNSEEMKRILANTDLSVIHLSQITRTQLRNLQNKHRMVMDSIINTQ